MLGLILKCKVLSKMAQKSHIANTNTPKATTCPRALKVSHRVAQIIKKKWHLLAQEIALRDIGNSSNPLPFVKNSFSVYTKGLPTGPQSQKNVFPGYIAGEPPENTTLISLLFYHACHAEDRVVGVAPHRPRNMLSSFCFPRQASASFTSGSEHPEPNIAATATVSAPCSHFSDR